MLSARTRPIGFAVLAAAAIAVTLLAAPASLESPDRADPPSTRQFNRVIDLALDDHEANEARTRGAPQQQVVNGWVARDLLMVIAQQQNALLDGTWQQHRDVLDTTAPVPTDNRIPWLLVLTVLTIGWHGATAGIENGSAPQGIAPARDVAVSPPAPVS